MKKNIILILIFLNITSYGFDDSFFDDIEPDTKTKTVNSISSEEDPFERAKREREEAEYQRKVEALNQYYKDSVSKLKKAKIDTAKIDQKYQEVSNKDYDLQEEERRVKNYEKRVKRQQKRLDKQMYAQERRKDKQVQNALYQDMYTGIKQATREGLQRAEQERQRVNEINKVLFSKPKRDYSQEPITIQVDSDLLSTKPTYNKPKPQRDDFAIAKQKRDDIKKHQQEFYSGKRKTPTINTNTISLDDIDNDFSTPTKVTKTKPKKKEEYENHIEAIAFYWKVKRSGLEKKYMSTGEYKGDGPVQNSTGIAETLDEKIANSGCENYRKKVAYSQDGKDGFIFYCNYPLQSYDRNIANTQNISNSYILNERKKYKCIKTCMWSRGNKTRMNKCCKEY
jgi:hypothetical protein